MLFRSLANHVLGEDFVTVRAGFSSLELQAGVLLSSEGRILVNGVRLPSDTGALSHQYVTKIPIGDHRLRFELFRSAQQRSTFEIAVPIFKVEQYPASFRNPETLSFRLAQDFLIPYPAVIEDKFALDIYSNMAFGLSQVKRPTPEDPVLVVRPILENLPQPRGRFNADLYRLQRTPLRDATKEFKTGWTVAIVGDRFTIDVLG